jgi:hypothetical protein
MPNESKETEHDGSEGEPVVGQRTLWFFLTGLLAGGVLGWIIGLSFGNGRLSIAGLAPLVAGGAGVTAFTFANPDDWQQAVTGSLLSHMGKHGPMILMRPDGLTEQGVRYLEMLKPTLGAANDQLNNHGWILGGTDRISWATQADIDLLLEPREASR